MNFFRFFFLSVLALALFLLGVYNPALFNYVMENFLN